MGTRKSHAPCLLFFVCIFTSSLFISTWTTIKPQNVVGDRYIRDKLDIFVDEQKKIPQVPASAGNHLNPYLFWTTEKNRVNEVPIAYNITETTLIQNPNGTIINRSIIEYYSPNFVDRSEFLRLNSILLIRNELLQTVNSMPAVLLLHGLKKKILIF